MTVLANRVAFWKREELGMRLQPGMDEVSLAFVADAWSRTYRSTVASYASSPDAVTTMSGVRIVPDRTVANRLEGRQVPPFAGHRPADALDSALDAIAARYGVRTADVVAMQLEYPRPATSR
jgi:hypothetical protein